MKFFKINENETVLEVLTSFLINNEQPVLQVIYDNERGEVLYTDLDDLLEYLQGRKTADVRWFRIYFYTNPTTRRYTAMPPFIDFTMGHLFNIEVKDIDEDDPIYSSWESYSCTTEEGIYLYAELDEYNQCFFPEREGRLAG